MNRRILTFSVLALLAGTQAYAQFTDSLGFSTAAASNASELLRGRVSGVRVSSIDGNPSGLVNVHIRGLNSLRSDNQPLWIVDGAMVSNDLNDNIDAFWQYGERNYTAPLNPLSFLSAADIESIEVLKDASATAIYGARGANGVIIINTRKSAPVGKRFSFDANAGVNTYGNVTGRISALHNYRAAIDGRNGNTAYNISATFRHNAGYMSGCNSNYGSVKANFNSQANKVVWFGFNTLFSIGQSSSTTGVAYFGAPSYNLAVRDGALSPGMSTSLWEENYDDDSMDYRAVSSALLTLNITDNLKVKASAGIDFQDNSRYVWYGDGLPLGSIDEDNVGGGAAAILTAMIINYNGKVELNYNRYFAGVHHVSADAGFEALGYISKFNTMNKRDFATHELRAKGLNLGNSPINNRIFPRDYARQAVFARVAYSFGKIFGMDATYRYGRTPRYKGLVDDRYPAVNVWVDLHESFFRDFRTVSSLHLKGGYGISGKEKYVPFELFSNYLSGGWFIPENGTESFYDGMDRLRTKEFNVGVDAGFLSDRFRLGVSFYDRETTDTFEMFCNGAKFADASYWGWRDPSVVFDRVSSIANQGFEFDFNGTLMKTSKLRWTLSANLSCNVNQVASSNPEDFAGKKVGQNLFCTCNTVGLPVSSLFGYKTDASGNIVDVTGEGIISSSDKVVLGNSIPVWSGGLQTVLAVGRLRFEMLVDGAAGHSIANVNELVKDGFRDSSGQIALSGKYIERGDYLRLSEVGVGYDVPIGRIKWLKGLNVRLSAHNLATLTSYSGWNPDVNSFGVSTLANGYDYGSYPLNRSVILGVSLKF